jgi:hypothetical protein
VSVDTSSKDIRLLLFRFDKITAAATVKFLVAQFKFEHARQESLEDVLNA